MFKKGAQLDPLPTTLQVPQVGNAEIANYRKAPLTLIAASSGSLETLQTVISNGGNLWESGHICLSRKKKNSVIGNVIGLAAYMGHDKILNFALGKASSSINDEVNTPCLEQVDVLGPNKTVKSEFDGFNPLMLAMVSEKPSLEIVKKLLAGSAHFDCRAKHNQDNILHLAARHQTTTAVLEYLVKSIDHKLLFERNAHGETPLSIAEARKWEEATKLLSQLQANYDKSNQKADDLLSLIDQEQARAEREKQKRKEKKQQQKVKKIAAENGCSLEEAQRKIEDFERRKAEEEAERERQQRRKEEEEERQRVLAEKELLKIKREREEEIRRAKEEERVKRQQERALLKEQQIQKMREQAAVERSNPRPTVSNATNKRERRQEERKEYLRAKSAQPQI